MRPLHHPSARLVFDEGISVSGADLTARIDSVAAGLAALPPGPVFCGMRNDLTSMLRYLAAFQTGRPIALLDPQLPAETLHDMAVRYQPTALLGFDADVAPAPREAPDPHPDLALLMATSGSTGNPKLVRLSRAALLANAASIVESLAIDADEIAPTSLPLHYIYGLSVANSHLHAGATLVLTDASVMERTFWSLFDQQRCSSLAAVPYQYELLHKLRFAPEDHPSLRAMTQSGGTPRTELILHFAARIDRFYKMYGTTEAAPRMTVLPPDQLVEKASSVGPAVPGGQVSIEDDEIVYRGQNVMMGYAEHAGDLARGDDMGGVLHVGDLGRLDEESYLYVTGRMKRLAKVFGVRINLDDVERMLLDLGPVAATIGDDKIVIWAEGADASSCSSLAKRLGTQMQLHWSGFDVRGVDRLPLLRTGKIDYRTLESQI